jgi:hypothetical protein
MWTATRKLLGECDLFPGLEQAEQVVANIPCTVTDDRMRTRTRHSILISSKQLSDPIRTARSFSKFVSRSFSKFVTTHSYSLLSHTASLAQHHILVEDGLDNRIGLIDWEYASWYPEHWDYL